MAKLIEDLRGEHKTITEMLNKVRELGIGSAAGQKMLDSAKSSLLAHLKKEDKELYPVLKSGAASNDALKRTMDIFARDMEAISEAALAFFEKYAHGDLGLEFARDFGRLYATLGSRIKKEEDILYKEFEKLTT